MLFESIHHIAIICSDYNKSKYFYTHILGFLIIRETYRKDRLSYKLDLKVNENTQIELFSFPNSPKRVSQPEACGLRHIAFRVLDIQKAIIHLNSHDITVEKVRVDKITSKLFTFFADPDGLPLELYQI